MIVEKKYWKLLMSWKASRTQFMQLLLATSCSAWLSPLQNISSLSLILPMYTSLKSCALYSLRYCKGFPEPSFSRLNQHLLSINSQQTQGIWKRFRRVYSMLVYEIRSQMTLKWSSQKINQCCFKWLYFPDVYNIWFSYSLDSKQD